MHFMLFINVLPKCVLLASLTTTVTIKIKPIEIYVYDDCQYIEKVAFSLFIANAKLAHKVLKYDAGHQFS